MGDYDLFLKHWLAQLDAYGLSAFSHRFSDYTPPYLYLLYLITVIKTPWIISVKILSGIFDYLCAYAVGLICSQYNIRRPFLLSMAVVPLIPTLLTNSMLFTQCDSIYTFFVLMAVYFAMRQRSLWSTSMLGVAFAFKLQTILVFPFFFILLLQKKVKLVHFLVIPLIYLVAIIPALLGGGSFIELISIYLTQSSEYRALALAFPNPYLFLTYLTEWRDMIKLLGIALVFVSTIIAGFACRKLNFGPQLYPFLALASVVLTCFFLPGMHERYMYCGDLLSVACAIVSVRYIPVALGVIGVSTISYLLYLRFVYFEYALLGGCLFVITIAYMLYLTQKQYRVLSCKP